MIYNKVIARPSGYAPPEPGDRSRPPLRKMDRSPDAIAGAAVAPVVAALRDVVCWGENERRAEDAVKTCPWSVQGWRERPSPWAGLGVLLMEQRLAKIKNNLAVLRCEGVRFSVLGISDDAGRYRCGDSALRLVRKEVSFFSNPARLTWVSIVTCLSVVGPERDPLSTTRSKECAVRSHRFTCRAEAGGDVCERPAGRGTFVWIDCGRKNVRVTGVMFPRKGRNASSGMESPVYSNATLSPGCQSLDANKCFARHQQESFLFPRCMS